MFSSDFENNVSTAKWHVCSKNASLVRGVGVREFSKKYFLTFCSTFVRCFKIVVFLVILKIM